MDVVAELLPVAVAKGGTSTQHRAVVTVLACLEDSQSQFVKEAGVVEVTPAFEAAPRTRRVRGEGRCWWFAPVLSLVFTSVSPHSLAVLAL